MTISRSRLGYAAAAIAVIAIGLFSRSGHTGLPRFWTKYSGDALWALLIFVLVALILHRRSTIVVAAIAFAYSCATEFSQLYHSPWIDAARRTTLGHLVLGDTFAWADMIAYLVGVVFGVMAEVALRQWIQGRKAGAGATK